MKVLRMFPRRTHATPTDENVRINKTPSLFDEADEVHISVTFTWDIPQAEFLFNQWKTEGLPLWGKQFSKYYNDIYIKKWNVKITNETVLADYQSRCEWVNACGLCLSDKCCKVLKEDILHKNKAHIVGLRMDEGGRRSTGKNKEYDFCVRNSKVLFKPIFDLTNSELAEMEKVLKIEPLNIYNYLDRTGCVMCGFGTKKQIAEKINYLRWYEPKRAEFYVKYFNNYLKYRKII